MGTAKAEIMKDDGRFENPNKVAVLMLSGGVDSTTLAYKLASEGKYDKIHAFINNVGVASSAEEYNAANRTCQILGFRLVEADFSWWRKAIGGLVPAFERDPAIAAPMLGEQSRKSYGFNAACAVYAETIGCFDMYHGVNKDDLERYTFIPPTFRSLEEVMSLGHADRRFKIHTPWIELTGVEVLREAVRLKVPLEDTWSCLGSSYKHCGVCRSCVARRNRFKAFGESIEDPAQYEIAA